MRIKCQKCDGKGGTLVTLGRWNMEVWRDCQQCHGKGRWWPNQKTRKKTDTGKRN